VALMPTRAAALKVIDPFFDNLMSCAWPQYKDWANL
jgi:hypothetical protein